MSTHTQPADSAAVPGSASFESVYRANVTTVTAFFARRCREPQTVADLTSQTFVDAIGSFEGFDPRKGSERAWLLGIARHVYAAHYAATIHARSATRRLAGQLTLDEDEIEQLTARIDDQRAGRRLLERCARLPELDRAAIELVDLAGLTPHGSRGRSAGVARRAARSAVSSTSSTAKRSRQTMTNFEDHLWSHLVDEHCADQATSSPSVDGGRHPRPLVLGGAVAGVGAIAAGVVLALTATSATPPAYAVTDNHNGTATVTLRQIGAIDQLNARLARLGIRARAVPILTDCHAHDQVPVGYSGWKTGLNYKITVGNRWLTPGDTAIMAVKQTPAGIEAAFGAVPTREIPGCVPSTVAPVITSDGVLTSPVQPAPEPVRPRTSADK